MNEKISLTNDAEYRAKSARLTELKTARHEHKQRVAALTAELSRMRGADDDVTSADAEALAFGDGGGGTATRTRADVRAELAEVDKALRTTESAIKLLEREVASTRTKVSQRLCESGELAEEHKRLVRDAALALKAYDDAALALRAFYDRVERDGVQWIGVLPGAPVLGVPFRELGSVGKPGEDSWPLPRVRTACIEHGYIKPGEWPGAEVR